MFSNLTKSPPETISKPSFWNHKNSSCTTDQNALCSIIITLHTTHLHQSTYHLPLLHLKPTTTSQNHLLTNLPPQLLYFLNKTHTTTAVATPLSISHTPLHIKPNFIGHKKGFPLSSTATTLSTSNTHLPPLFPPSISDDSNTTLTVSLCFLFYHHRYHFFLPFSLASKFCYACWIGEIFFLLSGCLCFSFENIKTGFVVKREEKRVTVFESSIYVVSFFNKSMLRVHSWLVVVCFFWKRKNCHLMWGAALHLLQHWFYFLCFMFFYLFIILIFYFLLC